MPCIKTIENVLVEANCKQHKSSPDKVLGQTDRIELVFKLCRRLCANNAYNHSSMSAQVEVIVPWMTNSIVDDSTYRGTALCLVNH